MNGAPLPEGLNVDLVRRLDIAAPRYTSYPTVPMWPATESDDAFRAVLREPRREKPVSLYLHVPFCPRICHYCGCNTTLLESEEQVSDYVTHLLTEIRALRRVLPESRRVVQIHFGGGTPSVLSAADLRRILDAVVGGFDIDPRLEQAVETNPMTCSDESCDLLAELGFNRVSLGVQDFDSDVQRRIGRWQTLERTEAFVVRARARGVSSLNFDLVYGLPGQTREKLTETLAQVVRLRPDRIAVYSFAYLPRLRANQQKIDPASVPSGREKLDLYLLTHQTLLGAGYRAIGMDHFALPTDELAQAHAAGRLRRNFMGYTTQPDSDVLAFGATAIADLGNYYSQNRKDPREYAETVDAGALPVARGMALDADDRMRRDVIMAILCNGSVVVDEIEARHRVVFSDVFAPEMERLAPLSADGLITISRDELKVTSLGAFFLRNLALVFDAYLDGRKAGATGATFSRTV